MSLRRRIHPLTALVLSLLGGLWLPGCGGGAAPDGSTIDGGRVRTEMAERRVYRLTPGELLMASQSVGDAAVERLEGELVSRARRDCPEGDTIPRQRGGGLGCTVYLARIMDSLEAAGVKVHRLPLSQLGDEAIAREQDPKVRAFLEASVVQIREGQDLPPSTQRYVEGEHFMYLRGMALTGAECLCCHRVAGRAPGPWQRNEMIGLWMARIEGRPAALRAQQGKKGM